MSTKKRTILVRLEIDIDHNDVLLKCHTPGLNHIQAYNAGTSFYLTLTVYVICYVYDIFCFVNMNIRIVTQGAHRIVSIFDSSREIHLHVLNVSFLFYMYIASSSVITDALFCLYHLAVIPDFFLTFLRQGLFSSQGNVFFSQMILVRYSRSIYCPYYFRSV